MTPLNHRRTSRLRAVLRMVAMPLLFLAMAAAVRGQSALDGFDPNANGPVRVVVLQPAGKILLGGEFTFLSPNGGPPVARAYMARLNPDGTLDTTFNPNPTAAVYAITVQPDGKVLVGGAFGGPNGIGGQPRNNIARLDPSTGQADSFNPSANGFVVTIAVQADGKILAGGLFSNAGGQPRNNIVRLDPTTSLADSFDANANGLVRSIVVQGDGKILVGGYFNGPNSIGGQMRNRVARLDAATGLADSFDPNANNYVESLAVQADGKILVGGNFNSIGGQSRWRIARLDATTGLADSFDPHAVVDGMGDGTVYAVAVQPDGKILASGGFDEIGGQTRNRIARLDPTTGLADSFDPEGKGTIYSIALQPDGKTLAGGDFTIMHGQTRNRIARLEVDGQLDRTLSAGISHEVYVMAVQPDGKVLIGGAFTDIFGIARNHIARLNTDGTLDSTFNPDANNNVLSMAVQADGKILVGGGFTTIGGQARNRIARLDAATGLADSFDPNANWTVWSIAVQADGKILAGGLFNGPNSIGGQARNRMARLDPTTGLADSFDPNANNTVESISVQADGKILASGWFNGANSIGGQTRNRIARLDPTTGLADSFDPNANNWVHVVVIQPDSKILVGGEFTDIGGQTRNRIARLDATTGLPDSFNPNAALGVNAIAVQADGKVLAGGRFTGSFGIGGQRRWHIARLDAATGLADSFDPNANGEMYSIVVQSDGKILVGGIFTNIGGQTRNGFARLSNDTSSLQDLAVTQTTVAWMRDGSSPQVARVSFEYSIDNVIYTALGNGTLDGNSWILSDINLPTGQNLYVRARGYYRSGFFGNTESLAESVRNVFLSTPAGTPSPSPTSTPTLTATPAPSPSVTPIPPPTPSATPTPTSTPSATATATPTITATSTPAPSCTGDTWTATSTTNAAAGRYSHTAIWTGDEMIVWGGYDGASLNTGGGYNPGTDSWTKTSVTDTPTARSSHVSVWTGHEMVVWGGGNNTGTIFNSTGGRYTPGTDSWTATSTSNAPSARYAPTGIWTGSEMIVWGGYDFSGYFNTGGRYSPSRDSWTATSTANAPTPRYHHTAVWTGSEMIVWGGGNDPGPGLHFNTGGRYSGATDTWTATSATNAPTARSYHTAIWTGTEMIVWGGYNGSSYLNTGGRYNPTTNSWTPTSLTNAPTIRTGHKAVWTGREMIIWGGGAGTGTTSNSGARYDPVTDSWTATSTIDAASPRGGHTAIWTDREMIVWGGSYSTPGYLNTGGKYCAQLLTPTPAPTATATATATPTAPTTATPTPTATVAATSTPTATIVPSSTPTATASPTPTATPTATTTIAPSPTPSTTVSPIPTVTPTATVAATPTPSLTPTPPPATQAINLSTRMRVQTGDNVGIGGFIVTGSAPKHVVLRAIGPSLAQLGVPDVLADPMLELYGPAGFVTINDNWRDDQANTIAGTGLAPTNDLEAAIDATLAPGAYTAIVRGKNDASGVALIEVYDLDQSASAKLANISTRALVGTSDNIVIAGFILGGAGDDRLVLRGIGPSLAAVGVANALADPKLELRDSDGALLASNNDWQDDPAAAGELIDAGLAPASNLESGLALTLPSGLYTVLLSGVNNGVGLVEVYDHGP